MRKLTSIILILLHIILVIPIDEVFAAEYCLKASTVSPGKKVESGSYKLKQSTIGEPFGGKTSNSNYKVSFGYIPSTALNYPRLISNIPDGFTSVDLDDYFQDPCGRPLSYSVIGNSQISVSIDSDNVVTWSHPSEFVGSEELFFIAKNIENAQAKSNGVILTAKATSGNNAPKLHHIEDITAYEGDTIELNASAYDADGDTLTYTYTYPFDANGQWETDYEDAGEYTAKVTVSDGKGGSDSQTVNITILNTNRAPIIESVNGISVVDENVILSSKDEGDIVKLEPYAYDPDGDPVSFKYESPFDSNGSWQISYDFTGKEATKPVKTKIIVTDGTDSSHAYVTITINNVNAPPLVNLSVKPDSIKVTNSFTITVDASDPDGDNITLTLKKIKESDIIEVLEDSIAITSIYNQQFTASQEGDYVIEAIIKEAGTTDLYESTAKVYLEVTPKSQNEDAIKPVSGDFNGDGFTDIGYLNTDDGSWHISLSDNGNFNGSDEWLTNFCKDSEAVPLTGDFNGDSLTDIGYFDKSGMFKIKFSNGSSFEQDTIEVASGMETKVTVYGGSYSKHVYCSLTGDFNGDGLTDIGHYHHTDIWYDVVAGGERYKDAGEKFVAYSTGNGFTDFEDLGGPNHGYNIPITTDFNGDGLADFCRENAGTWKIVIYNGHNLLPNEITVDNFGTNDTDPLIGDFNQDGLTDIGYFDKDEGKIYYRAFKGDTFENTNRVYLEGLKTSSKVDSKDDLSATVGDYNGDGILDGATFDKTTTVTGMNKWSTVLHNSKLPDLLINVDNGIGGETSIEYTLSTELDNTGADGDPTTHDLPFPVRVVKKVTKSDGLGHSYTTTYAYKDGYFETDSREFRGFGYVKQIDSELHYKETFFLQDDIYKGRPEREVVYDKYNRKIQEINYNWGNIQYYDGKVIFPRLEDKTTTLYDYKTGDSKDIQTIYDYDEYGNVIKIRDEGFLDETGDEKETIIEYEYNIAKYIVSKPKLSVTNGTPEVKTQYTYDDNGSLLKEERWLDTESRWIATEYTYDSYGNLKTTKDALGRITTTTYEDTKTFPASVTNALGHIQSFTYDKAIGKILTSTDPNGQTSTSEYDGFGRLIKATVGGISEASYTYDLNSIPVKISTTTKASDTETITTDSWIDGLGRTIKTISEADGGRFIQSGMVEYDSRGQVIKKYLPKYTDDTTDARFVSYQYDALGRVVMTIRPDNKVSQNIYAITTTETINENAQRKRVTKDAYGRIIKVEEFIGDDIYTTTYKYDTLDNLIETKDTLGNITTIKYDSLGRKIDMNDPDMGTWTYTYDDVGNLKSQTDANLQTITFDYDDINRLTFKSTGVTYTYDQGANSVGRLSKVIDSSGTTEFFYDILGREIKTIKAIDSTSYTIERTYDSLDRLTSVKYPDTVIVKYEYGKQGVKKVYSPGTGGDVIYVQDAKYNANSQITEVTYGNGRKTTYEYDPDNLRLEHLVTANTSGLDPIQDLSYTFDPLGNIKQITDTVNSNTQSFSYDDLNRLISATGPHYSTINYEYDPIGNVTKKGNKTLVYGEGTAGPHAVTKYGDTVITYDANGNMETKGSVSYTYDIENRLTEVAIPKGGEVSSITLNFTEGWNFFSIPYKLIDQDGTLTPIENIPIGTLLSDINGNYDQIDKYDESIDDPNTGHWLHYVGNSKFDQFDKFTYGEGYLIYITTPCSITITGSTPSSTQQKTLNAGLNLVLAPTTTSISVQDALEGITYDFVKVYNGTTYENTTTLEAGKAYWIKVSQAQTWSIKAEEDVTQFVYDGDSGRVKRIFEDRTTIYIGSSYEITIDNATNDIIKYKKLIFIGSQRVCEVEQNLGTDEIHAYFVHVDHIQSSNIITNEAGQRVSLFEYKPFGSVAYAAEDNTYDTDKKFNGRTYDASIGLIFYGGRYFLPDIGRWLTADPTIQHPYDPQNLNRYSFLQNNPINAQEINGYGFWSKLWKGIKNFLKNYVIPIWAAIEDNNWVPLITTITAVMTMAAIMPVVGAMTAASAATGAGVSFTEGFLIGAVEMGIPAFTTTLAGGLASGQSFGDALAHAGMVAGITAITAGLIEGSYAAGWQNKLHFTDTRVAEINEIQRAYATGDYAKAHYLEKVVARKGISISTAEKLGWPTPKRTLWDKLVWRGKGEPWTQGWYWETTGHPQGGMASIYMGKFTENWENVIYYKQIGKNIYSLGPDTYRTWRFTGSKTTQTQGTNVFGLTTRTYPYNKSPWE